MNNKIDWEKIEFDYRAGIKTLREIAVEHGITHAYVNKKANQEGWMRAKKIRSIGKVKVENSKDVKSGAGFIYVIYFDDSGGNRFYKVGMSVGVRGRLSTHQGSSPFDLYVACAYYVGNMRAEEYALHQMFESKLVRGEWYALDYEDLKKIAARSLLVNE